MWWKGCPASEVNRIRPSGVQPRTVALEPRNVTRAAGPPVAGMQYTSGWCSSRLVNATCRPSGDRAGWLTSDRLAVSRRATPPAAGTDHKSSSVTKAMVSPRRLGCRR